MVLIHVRHRFMVQITHVRDMCYVIYVRKSWVISVIVIEFVILVLICLYNVINLCDFVVCISRILRLDPWWYLWYLYLLYYSYCDCNFTAFRNRCNGVVQRTLADIGCLIVTFVKLQVFGVSSGWWIVHIFAITNRMFAVMCEFVVSVTTWRELVMTWERVHSPSRDLRLQAVSLRYSIELWSSCQWLYVCASSWTGWSRQPGVIAIYVYIVSCTASAVVKYVIM